MSRHLDATAAGVAFVTYWLRGRYGSVEDLGPAQGHYRWRIGGTAEDHAFLLHVAEAAVAEDLGRLREWLEGVAEDARSNAPRPPGHYVVSPGRGVARTEPRPAREVRRAPE